MCLHIPWTINAPSYKQYLCQTMNLYLCNWYASIIIIMFLTLTVSPLGNSSVISSPIVMTFSTDLLKIGEVILKLKVPLRTSCCQYCKTFFTVTDTKATLRYICHHSQLWSFALFDPSSRFDSKNLVSKPFRSDVTMWPDFSTKRCPNFPPKVLKAVFTFIMMDGFHHIPHSCQLFGVNFLNNMSPRPLKMAKSGHTDWW